MKLKSLLLGSAAALALSTGAQAADPIASFVSLDVCDAYGISGLTISSDDTCLRISGEVEYEFSIGSDAGAPISTSSSVDWQLQFEATTQADLGMAKAVIRLVEDGYDEVGFDRAYVSFGDTTVLTAGRAGSIFGIADDQHIDVYGDLDDALFNTGGHVIQIVSDLGNGWSAGAALEHLQDQGTAGGVIGYDGGDVVFNIGAYATNLFDVLADVPGEEVEFVAYVDALASFDVLEVFAGAYTTQNRLGAQLTMGADLGMVGLRAGVDVIHNYDPSWTNFGVGAGVEFALTDTVDLDLEVKARFPEGGTENFDATLTLTAALTETITGEVWAAARELNLASERFGGGVELAWAPGGNFETSVAAEAWSDESYEVSFNASKSF